MKQKAISLFIIILCINSILLLSCSENKIKKIKGITNKKEFQITKKIHLNKINKIRQLTTLDSLLIIWDDNNNHLIYVYNLNNLRFIKSFGKEGTKPGQIKDLMGISVEQTTKKLHLFDLGNQTVITYDLKKSEFNKEKIINLPINEGYFITAYTPLNDSLYATLTDSDKGRVIIRDINSNIKHIYNGCPVPKYNNRFTQSQLNQTFQGNLRSSPKGHIDILNFHLDVIERINYKQKDHSLIKGPLFIKEELDIFNDQIFISKRGKFCYLDGSYNKTGDLFALILNVKIKEYVPCASNVLVLDKNNTPVSYCKLPMCAKAITVGNNNKIYFGVNNTLYLADFK